MLQQGSLEISETEQGVLPLPHWMCTAWSLTCPWGLPCWKERDPLLGEGRKGCPMEVPVKLAEVLLSQDLSSWPSGQLLHFAPVSLCCQGSWGAGIRGQAQPLQIGGEGECGRFPSWGKGLVVQLGGENIKQSSFSSLLAQSGV